MPEGIFTTEVGPWEEAAPRHADRAKRLNCYAVYRKENFWLRASLSAQTGIFGASTAIRW